MNAQAIIDAAHSERTARMAMQRATFNTAEYHAAWKAWKLAEKNEAEVRQQQQDTLPPFCIIDPCWIPSGTGRGDKPITTLCRENCRENQ